MEIPVLRPNLLLIDNFDSFTYNLWDYFLRMGVSCEVVRADQSPLESLRNGSYDGIVLSPGPQRPKDAGDLMAVIEAFHDRLPMMGVCLGHQAIGEFFGAELVRAIRPVHGKTSRIWHDNDPVFSGLPESFSVMRYHSLVLNTLPETLERLAWTAEGEIMALRHRNLPLYGIQFHPESILTEFGLEILQNWVRVAFPAFQTVPRL
jgi:anthranilate synthase component II